MTHKIITGPDGKMYTEHEVPSNIQEKLQRTRKELREMISGNTQFHKDGLDIPKESPQQVEMDWGEIYGNFHGFP